MNYLPYVVVVLLILGVAYLVFNSGSKEQPKVAPKPEVKPEEKDVDKPQQVDKKLVADTLENEAKQHRDTGMAKNDEAIHHMEKADHLDAAAKVMRNADKRGD